MNMQDAMKEYQQITNHSQVNEAGPHRLIQMLMEGALDKMAIAKGHMERKEIPEKGNNISIAISIIGGLRASLDHEAGGDIAKNLDDLYDYMSRRLVNANTQNEPMILDEVRDLLLEIKSAWDEIEPK